MMHDNECTLRITITICLVVVSFFASCTGYEAINANKKIKQSEQVARAIESGADPVAASCAILNRACNDLMLIELKKLP